jgi:DNA primase
MPLISKTTIQEVIDRMDAVAVVSDYVQLEKRSGRWWGLCPFHQEKTGSFTVSPDMKRYHCFGCGKDGSVIDFVMEMDKLNFPEVVELLAKRFGVEIVYEAGSEPGDGRNEERNKRKEDLFELYRRMAGTFHYFLTENPEGEAAKQYIISRGLTKDMIDRFRLGYSPVDRHWLFGFLSRKGYSGEFLAASGLFSSRYPGIPLFSGRLMFPIADRQGRVVAFGGRILEEAPRDDGRPAPKYINSPETEIYKKGETLFAIDLALPEIRKTGTVHIVEGYMDVIALHQAGITNAVAPLGTAFTDDQARLLRRWAGKLILVFDSDKAGQEAARKGILTGRKSGFSCFVVVPGGEGEGAPAPPPDAAQGEAAPPKDPADILKNFGPEAAPPKDPADILKFFGAEAAPPKDPADILKNFGIEAAPPKDPADILKNFGAEALQKRVKCFITDLEYLINRAKSLYNIRDSEGKARAAAFIFPYLQTLDSEVSRDACIEAAADAFGVSRSSVAGDYRRFRQGQANSRGRVPGINTPKEELSVQSQGTQSPRIRMNDELTLLTVVAVHDMSAGTERIYPRFRSDLTIKEIEDQAAKELFIALEECFINDETGMDALLSRISSPELKKYIIERGMSEEFSANPDRLVADGIKKVTRKRLERRLDEIVIKLRGLKNDAGRPPSGNSASREGELEELLVEKMHIDAELRRL